MDYIRKYQELVKSYKPPEQEKEQPSLVSPRVVALAEKVTEWHARRPAPERWQPVQLGRIAAQFNVSRELAASALQYTGWVESKVSASSRWKPKQY